jgi:hypothetical protein
MLRKKYLVTKQRKTLTDRLLQCCDVLYLKAAIKIILLLFPLVGHVKIYAREV